MTTSNTPEAASVRGDEDDISLLDFSLTLVENLRLLVVGPVLMGVLALGLSYGIAPTYTATTRFLPPQQQQSGAAAALMSLGALGGLAGAATGIKNPNDQYVSLLKSRAVQDHLLKRFSLMARYEVQLADDARLALAGKTQVTASKDGLITVAVEDRDPAFAAELANAHVAELANLLGKLAVTEAQQRRVFFEKQLTLAKVNLTKAEQALQASGVSIDATKIRPETAVEGVARLQAQVTAQEVRVASMRNRFTDMAPEFRQALSELSALRAQLARADQNRGSDQGSDYVARLREFKYQETLFELFARQYELARVDESREGAVLQVVDAAYPPDRKSKPRRGFIAVGTTLVSFAVLFVFVLSRQAVRRAQADPESSDKLRRLHEAWRRATGRRTV